ncbi:MAG: hypothetical protein JWN72_218 [Thermoleophilia bacterium]|nr:hypothetical protein [Thermoleophilia bacterium]
MITSARTSPITFDVSITDRTKVASLPIGRTTGHFTASELPEGASVTFSQTGTRNGKVVADFNVTATTGDYTAGIGSTTKVGPVKVASAGGEYYPAQRGSQVGTDLTKIADALRGSDLLHSILDAAPAGEPKADSVDTVTFSYYVAGGTRQSGTFATDAVPAPLQQALDSARAVIAAATEAPLLSAPFTAPTAH